MEFPIPSSGKLHPPTQFFHKTIISGIIAVLIPFVALGLQWILWDYITPFIWFLFYPAIFISARIGRFWGGIASTLVSTLLVIFFFLPPQLSWSIEKPTSLFSIVVFLLMGYLFSDIQERFRRANLKTEQALEETKLANEKIRVLYEKTLEINELKSQFFADVSHELRTPLTLILGRVKNALKNLAPGSEIHHDVEVIERNARSLHRRVNDLLDLAKLDAGQMSMHYSQLDLASHFRLVALQFDGAAAERNIRFKLDLPETLPAQVDLAKCQMILLNLLSNAFKFTPDHGEIGLKLQQEGDRVVFQVSDSGPGIPPDKQNVIFDRFQQLEGSASRTHGGTGLGLSIVKECVKLHQGGIHLVSAVGQGSLFQVWLPAEAPPGIALEPEPEELDQDISRQMVEELDLERRTLETPDALENTSGSLILVVEDHPDMRDFLISTLARRYRVVSAGNGQQGLEKAIFYKPDLILADMMIPEMSGDQMVRAIRQRSDLQDIPIVILTAKMNEETRTAMLQIGVQDYLNKPFSEEELTLRIANILADRQRSSAQLHASEERFTYLFQNMVEGFAYCKMIFDQGQPVDWIYLQVNPAFEALTGLKNVTGKNVSEIIPNIRETDPILFDIYARVASSGTPEKFEIDVQALKMWFSVSVYSPEKEYFVAVFDVITQRKQAESELQKSLAEKTTLLRELYHRTKNNMAVIIALLEMQADNFPDERLRQEFDEAKNRIRSMALVHQKLYESNDLSRINLNEYIRDLVEIMVDSYQVSKETITPVFDMQDVFVLIDSAVPCGLIVNELISNSLKYAFQPGDHGQIQLVLRTLDHGEIELCISDNGRGVPEGFDFRRDGHMGLQTVFILTEHQLQGQVEFDAQAGVTCKIRFQDMLYKARV